MQTTIAVLALIVSLISLGWQAWTWARSGPRVTAEVDTRRSKIIVRNHGRMPITIESIWIMHPALKGWRPGDAFPSSLFLELAGPDLPHRLESHSSATWSPDDPNARLTDEAASVVLGSGRTLQATPTR